MSEFIQLHVLTAYPPSNLNRDDLGRPKSAMVGGVPRLRVSSQSLKRAWRTSSVFEDALAGHMGTRTKEMGRRVYASLRERDVAGGKAAEWSAAIAEQFGKRKTKSDAVRRALKKRFGDDDVVEEELRLYELEIEQLAHFSPEEVAAIDALVDTLAARGSGPETDELDLLKKTHKAADIALFGRMLAAKPAYNVEAAAQVAHAFTVNRVSAEQDFFTAVDDLNDGQEDVGAGHMGEIGFGAGVYYLYLCIDRHSLADNLAGDQTLAAQVQRALAEVVCTVAPTGKQNSFAARSYASYVLAERGSRQPRTLATAFVRPVPDGDVLATAIERIEECRDNMDKVYGPCVDNSVTFNCLTGSGSLAAVQDFLGR